MFITGPAKNECLAPDPPSFTVTGRRLETRARGHALAYLTRELLSSVEDRFSAPFTTPWRGGVACVPL